ncbi:putative ferric-chelate reductase 1 isoform X1 [Pristis pectinata]|uniref:putative ferric-chelate reductase 1 isoform X1 n=1 Tax=Pristis pectinata TaxID=685728 RepID=UPI00223DFE85|nr:putative ferric-chelate reductase 1 isoform X1 [Pristis pectinata]XP_051869026.1 putative ferric-chelate reductase 1 isoform X1 [Pristis pectinata]
MGLHIPRLLAVFGIFVEPIVGYRNGLVTVACDSMIAKHGAVPQKSPSPAIITVDKNVINASDQIKVTLSVRQSGTSFQGFFIQARDAADLNAGPLGTFTLIDDQNSQLLTCGGVKDSAVSHTSSSGKHTIEVLWNPPLPKPDHIQFLATVVQKFNTYWVKLRGPIVSQVNAPPLSQQAATESPPVLPITTQLAKPFNATDCGDKKSCLRNPTGCDPELDRLCFFLSFTVQGSSVLFELSGPSNGYISFALSDDKWMGDDDVYLCVVNDQSVQINPAHSTGRSHPILNSQVSIYDMAWRLEDGVTQCSFRRNIRLPKYSERFDLDRRYYIFLAEGKAENGRIHKHHRQPLITQGKVHLHGSPKELQGSRSPRYIKAHGSLMFIAWVTTANIGVIVARFFKSLWPSTTLFGKKIWFQVHRILMMTTVLFTCLGFILPFLYRGGWSHYAGAHPYFGCMILTLVILQPLVAIFRPNPSALRRYLFNWFHWATGTFARIIAVGSIFLGMDLPALDLRNPWDTLVMVGFIVWHVATELILEAHNYIITCKAQKREEDKMEIMDSSELIDPQGHRLKMMVLTIYICGNLTFLIILLVGISLI